MRSAFPRIAPAFALHCARKTMPTRYQSRFRSILPPFLSIGGGRGYEIPDELALASVFSEMKWLAVEWWPIDRCHQKRKKKNVCVYRCQRLTDFFLRGKEVGMRERGVKRKAKEIEIRRNERN